MAKEKEGEFNVDEWELVACTRNAPRQIDGCSCGVFVCMSADCISMDYPPVYGQDHVDYYRRRMALSLMNNCAMLS